MKGQIITVSPSGHFIGRFANVDMAAKYSPDTARCITQATDLHFLNKKQLEPLFKEEGLEYNKNKVNASLHKELFAHYQTKEVKVTESKEKKKRTPKEKKAPVDRSKSRKAIVHKAWAKKPDTPAADLEKISNGVKLSTIKSWIGQWKRGVNIPAYAKTDDQA